MLELDAFTLFPAHLAWMPDSRIFEGPQALATLHAHRADIAFLGACALHRRVGLTANEAGDMALKRAMIRLEQIEEALDAV